MALKKLLAYTLVEVLVTVAVIGGLGAGAYLIISNVSESSTRAKLEQDVRAVNRALQIYQTHGGKLPSGLSGDAILTRLRKQAANAKLAGLQGSMIDPRMTIRWQSSGEAASTSLRAYWDDASKQFVIAESGSDPGVKEFYLGEMPNLSGADGLDTEREGMADFASNDKWVWDYNSSGGATRVTPDLVPTGAVDPNTTDGLPEAQTIPLDPPVFSVRSGTFPITWFPGTVTLSLPPSAPPTVAEIYFYSSDSSGGSNWQRYDGPLAVEPGTTIVARTVTLDPDHFEDSGTASEAYELTSMQLEIAASFPRTAFNYRELGGTMQGATSTPQPPFGLVTVTNITNVPAEHISSDKFQIFWTFDGSDPGLAASTGRVAGPVFQGGHAGTQVPIILPAYRPDGTATVRIRAVAIDPLYYRSSEEQTISFGIEKLTLPGTTLSVDSDKVVMATVTDSTRLPAGSRIFFKDDGSDPGSNNGEPADGSAQSYTVPVVYPAGLTQYTARSYPPSSLVLWFNVGDPSTIGTGTTPDGYYFATSPGKNTLYQFDSSSGSNIVRSTECLFPPAGVAYLTESGRVYYVEQAAGGWNLGRYDLTTGTHAVAGQLTGAGLDYIPTVQPKNLVGYNNSIYYVGEDSDDLVRVDFQPNGSIRAQYKFADVADDLTALHNVGDVAADNSGTLYISAQNAWATYNLKSLSGFTVPVTNPSWVWSGLVTGTGGEVYGVRDTEAGRFYSVDKTTGQGSTPVDFTPTQSFDDFGGPLGSVPFQLPPGHFALSPGRDDVFRLNLDTGRHYIFASNIGITPTALAANNAGGILYAAGPAPTDSSNILLTSISVSTGEIATVGSLTESSLAFRPISLPDALTWFNGALYHIPSNTSSLVKVDIAGGAITGQTLVTDILEGISIHPILGVVDGMTIGPDGQLYVASSNHHLLFSYDIGSLGGFNNIRSKPESTYSAITYRADKQMIGVPATSSESRRQIFTVDDNTGDQTFLRNVVPPLEISDITGIYDSAATAVTSDYFAVDGVTTRIYRFDPATGANAILTSTAPWVPGAVAYDGENQRLYYTRLGGTQVGSYGIATGVHTLIGTLNDPVLTTPVSASPGNLTFFNGSLYFVPPASDDLIRVDLGQTGAIADAWKVADINANNAFLNVADIAVDANGLLYLSDATIFARFDLKSLSGYAVLSNSLASPFDAIFTEAGSGLYGLSVAAPRDIVAVNPTDGSTTPVSITSPLRNFVDAASAQQRVNMNPAGGTYYASATGKQSIYSLNITTGQLRPVTASCPVAPEALAYDNENQKVYYTETTSSQTSIGLYQYDLVTQRHVFVGNLALPGLGYTITSSPRNLVFFAGGLYTIPSGDDLVRIDLSGETLISLTKFADISGDASVVGNAGALAVDNTGIAWVSQDSGNLLAKFNFYTRNGYTVVNNSDARMTGLVFSSANALYGTHYSTPAAIQRLDLATGVRSAQATTSPLLSLRDITGLNTRPQPVLPDCYAVGGDNRQIYRFDPATGVSYIVTSSAPFTLNSLARDPAANVLYYTENSTSDWRLGKYSISAGTHTVLATIGNSPWNYPVINNPGNLFFYGEHLYFIAPGSDDLVQIGLNAGGTAVTGVTKATDLSEDYVNMGNVGDVAVDSSGTAWVATGNNALAKFSMVTLSGFTQLSSGQPNYTSLLFTNSGLLFGSHSGGASKVYGVDGLNGTPTFSADTFPEVTFWDMAGHETSVPYNRTNSLWAIDEDTGRLGEFLNWNLPNVVARTYGPIRYLNNGVSTGFSGTGYALESLAITSSGTVYFVRNEPTTINGTTYKRPLFTFELNSLTWGATPTIPLATFVGDLTPALSVTGIVGDVSGTDLVNGLAIGPDQRLYVLYSEGNNTTTDFLFRINSFSTASGGLNNVSLIGPVSGTGEAVTLGQDMVFSGGTLYITDDSDDEVYSINSATGAILSLVSSDASTKYEGLAVYPLTGEILGANADSGTADAQTIRRIRTGDGINDLTRFHYATLSGNALTDLEGLAFAAGSVSSSTAPPPPYFAVNRTSSIFRVDPATGTTTTATSSAPFNLDAIAYDAAGGVLYYVQNSNTTIQLGKFTVATGAHTILGDLKLTGSFRPSIHPQHLICYQGELYYIAPASSQSFLIRVQLTPTGILAQDSLTRLSATSGWNVTAAALDNSGIIYFREGTNLRSYDLRRLGNMTTVSSNSAPYESLLFASSSGTYFGSRGSAVTSVEPVNTTTGEGGTAVATSPALSLYDMTGGHSAPPQIWVNSNYYAVGGNNQELYVINASNADNSIKTSTPLFSSIAAVAADPTGDKAYYIQQGAPYTLAVYNRGTNTHTSLAQLANAGTVRPTSQIENLTWFNGHLYWLQPNTDNLYKIELRADGTFSDTFLAADIANNDEAAIGAVGDLAVDATGWLYISGSNRFAKYNLASLGGFATLALNPAAVWTGLMVDANGSAFYGVRSNESGNLYSVNPADGSGVLIGAFNAVRTISDLGSPQVPVPSLLDGQRYFITQNSRSISRLDLESGRTYRITSNVPHLPTGIAHDFTGNRLYLTTHTGTAPATFGTARLALHDLATGITSDLASLSSGFAFAPASMPLALVYAQSALYYIPPMSDDLVRITLTGNIPTAQTKVVDLNGNSSLGEVSALTVAPDGSMYISCSDSHLLAKYNLSALSGFDIIRTFPKANAQALTYDDNNVLHSVFAGEDTTLYTVNVSSGASAFKVAASSPVYDITGLNTDVLPAFSRSLWAISRNGVDHQLIEVKNWDVPATRTAVNWGSLTYNNGSAWANMGTSSIQIYGLALASSGVGYFVATGPTTLAGTTYNWGLYKLDLTALQAGVPPRVSFLGDLKPRLDALSPPSGSTESRWITGLTIQPSTGRLFGQMLDGSLNGADVLFAINSLQTGSGNSLTDLSIVGTMSGTASVTHGTAIAFDPNGTLYNADSTDQTVDSIDAVTAANLGSHSSGEANGYSALCVDPVSGKLLASEFSSTGTRIVVAGASNDTLEFSYSGTLGVGAVYAMSFLTWPVTLPETPPPLYYAANNTTTLYSFNAITGTTYTLTPAAPFPARSLAHDPQNSVLYYIENANSGFRLAQYNIGNSSHTVMGDLDTRATGTWSYDPTACPNNLEYSGGSLYYIHPNTDDLVRVFLSGTTIVDQVKIADLSANTQNFGGAVTELSIGAGNILWISAVNGLYKYDLGLLTGFTAVAPGTQYSGIFFNQNGNDLYGTSFAAQTTIHAVNQSTGVLTPITATSPAVSFEDFGAYPPAPPTPVGTYYAVNGTSTLYLMDQLTGGISAASAGAPFNMSAVAYDVDRNIVYYIQDGTDTWKLGRYNPATGAHSDMGRASETDPLGTDSGPQPNNLFVWNSRVYYIRPGTDDLMRIELTAEGLAPLFYCKVADITNNATSFSSIGDVAVSTSGIAYFASPQVVARFDLKTMAGYTVIKPAPAEDWKALLMAADNQLYGIHAADPARIFRITQNTGAITYIADIAAGIQFSDLAGRHPLVTPVPLNGQVYAAVGNSNSIHLVNVVTGANRLVTGNALFPVKALAYDYDNAALYYTEYSASSNRLGRFELRNSRHTIVSDLGADSWNYPASAAISSLVYSNGDLYYIHKDTDDLIRISLNNGTVSDQSLAAHITNNAKSLGDVGAMTIADGGYLYFSRADAPLFARYNMARRSSYLELNTSDAQFHSLAFYEGSLYGSRFAQSDRTVELETTDASVISTSPQTTPVRSLEDLSWITPEFTTVTSRYYATDRTSTIYQIDPASGETLSFASTAPVLAEAIAYDLGNDRIYYLETPGSGYRLGLYNADAATNTILGSLQAPGFSYVPADQPRSMVFYNGALYYIARNSDDLVRVEVSGTSIGSQEKIADLAGNTVNYDASSLAINNSGLLYFRSGSGLFRCDLRNNGSGLTTISNASPAWEGLVFSEDSGTLYGSQAGTLTRVDRVSTSSGSATSGIVTSPAVSLHEITGPNTAAPPAAPFYYAANSTNRLYRIDPTTSVTTLLANSWTISGTAINFDTIAYDQSAGVVYLVQNTDSSTRLGKYTVATGQFSSVGVFVDTTITGVRLAMRPLNLVAYQGSLYFIRRSSTTSERDDLIKISFSSAGTIAAMSKVADLNGNASFGDAVSATLDDDGQLYFSTASSFYKYDLRNLSGLNRVVSSFPQHNALLWYRESNILYGAQSANATRLNSVAINNGALGNLITTNPIITVSDLASGNTAPPPPWLSVPAVYAVGDFYEGTGNYRNIAKFAPDGTLDPSFNTGSGTNPGSTVKALARTSDGRILVGGDFDTFNGTARSSLARVNGDGSLDTSFAPVIAQSASGMGGTSYTINWSTLGLSQDVGLNGTDTRLINTSSDLHGLSSSGGFNGFGYQTFNNVGSSGVAMTLYYSQNMMESGGLLDGSQNGPNLFGPSGSGANGGEHPDRRVVGPWNLRYNNDQAGTITPATVALSFSEPVFLNQMIIGHLAKVVGGGTAFGTNLLTNGSFESGSWSATGYVPNSTYATSASAKVNISGSGHMTNWTPDKAHWIDSSTRATDGNRFLYILPSDQTWNFCVGQSLTVGGPASGRQLISGRTYRVRYSAVTFNPNFPTGAGATQGKPAVELGWTTATGGSGFSELQNVREDTTGLPATMSNASNWDNLQWRNYTGYFVAPEVNSTNYYLNFWLSMVKTGGDVTTATSGMLFDNVRVQEVTAFSEAYEHAYVRAYSTPDGTGTPVAADTYANLSAQVDALLGSTADPVTTADPNNVRMDDDSSNNVYHTVGKGAEVENRHGKVGFSWVSQPIRSIALSFWATSETQSVTTQTVFTQDTAPTNYWTSTSNTNSTASQIAAITGYTGTLTELFKDNIDDGFDTGPYSSSYDIVYDRPSDASGATIVYTGGPVITGNPIYLHIKGGNAPAGQAAQYVYDISTWNRTDTLTIADYWPSTGSISHIAIFGGTDTDPPPSGQPKFETTPVVAGGTASLSNITFRRSVALPGQVWAVAEQTNGKILIGGNFSSVNGVARKNLARLNQDGTLDTTFDPGTGPDDEVQTIEITPNGAVLVGGEFNTWNGSSAGAKVVLLTSTGARNTAWSSPVSVAVGDSVKWIKHTTTGVYIGGKFSAPGNGIARLNATTGAHDASFAITTGTGTGSVNSGTILDDGKVLVAGDFTAMNGIARNRIARLNTNGSLDASFAPTPAFDSQVYALLRLSGSGFAHAGGTFTSYNGNSRSKLTVLDTANGSAGTSAWGPSGMTINAIYNIK
jgi:uncharacterized delta-60 repeat protein